MNYRKTLLAASIFTGLCLSATALAQDGTPSQNPTTTTTTASQRARVAQGKEVTNLVGVTVVGIRASLQQSLDTKRNADAIVEAVTAEDIGKFPNTNVAEAMTLVPGVTIDRQFGQGDRVSIDGTDPSLNLSFLDGQPISQTPWQYGAQPNRGFDYTMLAPEIIGRIEIFKSPEARLTEGSLGGTVLLHTRKPLDMNANTISGSVGYAYNDRAAKGRPNGSILYSWKNDAQTFGIIASAQHYEEKISREGLEIFGYHPISDYASSPYVAAGIAGGSLNPNAKVPDEINSAYFQQDRKRDSATLGLQFRPTDRLDIDFTSLYVRENFDNWNQSLYPYFHATPGNITDFTTGPSGIVTGGHVCGVETAGCGPANSSLDSNIRKSIVKTSAFNLKVDYRGDGWTLGGAAGYSKADNSEMSQVAMEPVYAGGYTWDIDKGFKYDNPAAARDPANWHMGDAPGLGGWAGNYGVYDANTKDTYAQLDFGKDFNGPFNQLLLGVRYNHHEESMVQHVYGPNGSISLANLGMDGYTDTLDGFSGIWDGASSHVQPDRDKEYAWVRNTNGGNDDPGSFLNGTWKLSEKTTAAYAQLNFATDNGFHGNIGARYVHSVTEGSGYNYLGTPVLPPPAGSWVTGKSTHNNVLPSVNVAFDAANDVVLRFAAAKVIARPPYNMQVNNLFLNDSVLTGAGGNANLNPYKSNNFSLSAEWYFAEQSVLAASVFYKKIDNYTFVNTVLEQHYNSQHDTDPAFFAGRVAAGDCTADGMCTYGINRPTDTGSGKDKGFNLNYQQAFGNTGFGVVANYTYAKGTLDSGGALPYSSKNSVSLSPYYEKGPFSARLSYNWRSKYLAGGYIAGAAPSTTDAYADLGATLGWQVNPNVSVSLNAMNLLDEEYFQYLGTKDMPANKYRTGRRYMAAVHFKF